MDEMPFRLNSEPLRCKACGNRFHGEIELKEHYKLIHPGLSVPGDTRLGGRLNELYPGDGNRSIYGSKGGKRRDSLYGDKKTSG